MSLKVKQLLDDRVLVRRDAADEKSRGGLYIPDAAKQKPQRGEVLAVGPGKMLTSGVRALPQVKPGHVVLFTAWAGNEVPDAAEKDLVVMSEADILAVLG